MTVYLVLDQGTPPSRVTDFGLLKSCRDEFSVMTETQVKMLDKPLVGKSHGPADANNIPARYE